MGLACKAMANRVQSAGKLTVFVGARVPESFKNIISYVWEQGDTFEKRPLCRVDSLVFSQLSYFVLPSDAVPAWGWTGLPIRDLWRSDWLDSMTGRMYDPAGAKRLIAAMAASPRFRDVRICGYVSQIDRVTEMQFSGMSFRFLPDQTYVAYRGTDNTILGWKENFNMAFQVQMPAQVQAMRYLERTASRVPGTLWCGGHSKGGTLAVYACMTCEEAIRKRVQKCFSHDGPGFTSVMLAELEDAGSIPPVDKTIPKSSVFGMLFERDQQDVQVVRSGSSGFAQHDPLSWEVDGCDFVIEERLGRTASYVDNSLNSWIEQATPAERQRFVDTVFSVMDAGDETYTHDLRTKWRTTGPRMARAVLDLPPDDRDLLIREVIELVKELAPGG